MKKNLSKILLVLSLVAVAACCAAGTAFAAPRRWFAGVGVTDNIAVVNPWIMVTVFADAEFGSDEECVAEFTVRQWAENGNYKLILSKIKFFCPSRTEILNPDEMWEYYADGLWAPVSQAEKSELLPAVTISTHTAYIRLRITPGFFQKPSFTNYLEYALELTAELTPIP